VSFPDEMPPDLYEPLDRVIEDDNERHEDDEDGS
jgi:hypothetical protein